ncbi:hypothetical protein [Streptomyces sp. NPDC088915]|uniref:hypothetical protein n=1 Tax=Streptomyces sp. NPDC088915 TaxID=3365912 RepID=UPI00380B2759
MTSTKTAGDVLRAALADWDLVPVVDVSAFAFPLDLGARTLGGPYIAVADCEPTTEGPVDEHTGWLAVVLDEDGEPVKTLHDGTSTGPVDCAADSIAVAAVIAAFLTSPVSRHCDCYSQERYGRRHDRECNRYAFPEGDRS